MFLYLFWMICGLVVCSFFFGFLSSMSKPAASSALSMHYISPSSDPFPTLQLHSPLRCCTARGPTSARRCKFKFSLAICSNTAFKRAMMWALGYLGRFQLENLA